MQNILLLRVKTPIHLFTYSLFSTPHTKSKQYQSSVVHIRSSLVHDANYSLGVSPLLLSGSVSSEDDGVSSGDDIDEE